MSAKLGRIKKVVKETVKDCKYLEKKKDLTKEGKGCLLMAKVIEQILDE